VALSPTIGGREPSGGARPGSGAQAQVLAMLSRHEGATSGPQIAEAMGYTVRGFLAGLAKMGIRVDVLITCARRVALKPQGQGPLHHRPRPLRAGGAACGEPRS
jgi:hypothetical protein